jgi:dihydroorotate dehydrogenase
MYKFIRGFLFLFDAEKVHYFAASILKNTLRIPLVNSLFRSYFTVKNQRLHRNIFGIDFPNPVGLAAGFDKNATMFPDLFSCGFGFIEIGTITPKGQEGNEKPRLFRLKKDEAIINRMGFNNDGVLKAVEALKKKKKQWVIGGNIGKNKLTSNEDAYSDYLICFEALYPYVDYFVVNVSSPNTPNLRELQDKEPLTALLKGLLMERDKKPEKRPILLKIAPDLSKEQLDDIVDISMELNLDGLVATNTTIDRNGLRSSEHEIQRCGLGGLSGKPLREKATEVIRYLHQQTNGSIPIIGVGGIHTPQDALDKLEAGASLVQLYTGFVYEGPGLIRRINKAILKKNKV